jgi:triacylglycerol lipase
MKKALIGIMVLLFALPMVSMAATTKCATKYPIVLAHGAGFESNVLGIIDYWGKIPAAMRDNGAKVFITNVSALHSKAYKAAQWKPQFLEVLAVTGASKVNVIGHSDGCLYTRYAISNLGLASKVASHTSMAGPHRGSVLADMIMGIGDATKLTNVVAPMISGVISLINGGDSEDAAANGYELTRPYMIDVFNPNTPDMSGIYYQSYTGKVTNALGGGLMLATWALMKPYEGDNDGMVSVTSAKWGNFRGVFDGGFWSGLGGVNHFAEVGALVIVTPGYDAPTVFVNIAADLKNRGF